MLEGAYERGLSDAVEDEHAAGPEHAGHLGEYPLVLGLRVEVTERRPDVDHRVERSVGPRQLAHVALAEVQLRRCCTRDFQHTVRDVDAGDLETQRSER